MPQNRVGETKVLACPMCGKQVEKDYFGKPINEGDEIVCHKGIHLKGDIEALKELYFSKIASKGNIVFACDECREREPICEECNEYLDNGSDIHCTAKGHFCSDSCVSNYILQFIDDYDMDLAKRLPTDMVEMEGE